ncbi:hypothetical protein HQ571_02480 [Candidatus Kuenenbacteria bacterium]|nr:hypothetical protein [Candidatus Kuenenbacteria bacterium]
MHNFWLKFFSFIFAVILFCACFAFLFFNHADNLVKFAPVNAEVYLHSNAKFIERIPEKHFDVYLNWLEEKSTLTKDQWQEFFDNTKGEFGLFTINGQVFGMVRKDDKTLKRFRKGTIAFAENENAIYFPPLKLSESYLTETDWYNGARKRINFSKFTIYSKNFSYLNFPVTSITADSQKPIVIFGDNKEEQLKLTIFGLNNPKTKNFSKQNITLLSEGTNFYGKNVLADNIAQKTEYIPENFNFNLLSIINGPVEFEENQSEFTIYLQKADNDLEVLKSDILNIIAQTVPVEKEKLLPDHSVAVQLIADSSAWNFENKNVKRDEGVAPDVLELNVPEQRINLQLTETDLHYIIKNLFNTKESGATPSSSLTSHDSLQTKNIPKKCKLFAKSYLYMNLSNTSLSDYFAQAIVINNNPNKTIICID